jgi:hypothetical protein
MYLARGNQVSVETMEDIIVEASGSNITGPPGLHTYPEVLTLQWKNESDTVTLTLTNPKILQAANLVAVTNATIYGNPEYFRLSGNATLNVNIGGTNETESGPAVWRSIMHTSIWDI